MVVVASCYIAFHQEEIEIMAGQHGWNQVQAKTKPSITVIKQAYRMNAIAVKSI